MFLNINQNPLKKNISVDSIRTSADKGLKYKRPVSRRQMEELGDRLKWKKKLKVAQQKLKAQKAENELM